MWVGIGCGGLFLLSLLGGAVAWYFTYQAAQSALAAASALSTPLAPPTDAPPGATTPDPTGATDSSGAPLGGMCAKAAECCRKIIQKTNSGAQAEAGCLALKQLPEANCELPLSTYRKSAQLLGVKCD
jgi:hypothetical protein